MRPGRALRAAALACLATAMGGLSAAAAVPGGPLPADSLYQLRAQLRTQQARAAGFDLYAGHPTVVSMFYGSCPAACPMLITAIQVYESRLPEAGRARLRVLLVSFDAQRDTPSRLAELARLHRTDASRWTFASAADVDARKIAALLGFRYRRLSNGEFDHSLQISLLDPQGRLLASTTRLVGDTDFEARLRAATDSDPR
jgi:protein SCO1